MSDEGTSSMHWAVSISIFVSGRIKVFTRSVFSSSPSPLMNFKSSVASDAIKARATALDVSPAIASSVGKAMSAQAESVWASGAWRA